MTYLSSFVTLNLMLPKIRVFLIDQQPPFRQKLSQTLSQETKDIEVCGEAEVKISSVASLENTLPDVAIIDINFPSLTGIDLCRLIKRRLPSISIILTTPKPEDDQLFQAIKARAAAYISRDLPPEELITTIRRVAAGEYPINETLSAYPKVVEQIIKQFQDLSWGEGIENMLSPLTQREREVLNYMAQGYLNKQIALALGISEQTVKNHVTSILRKLDANARTQAVIIAMKHGLISPK